MFVTHNVSCSCIMIVLSHLAFKHDEELNTTPGQCSSPAFSIAIYSVRRNIQCKVYMVILNPGITIVLFVCVEVLWPSQQLRSCRASQLPIYTVPGQA